MRIVLKGQIRFARKTLAPTNSFYIPGGAREIYRAGLIQSLDTGAKLKERSTCTTFRPSEIMFVRYVKPGRENVSS